MRQVAMFVLICSLWGCAGHFVVKPTTPTSPQNGFRYYLPKPYLLVTNMSVAPDEASSPSPKQPDTTGAGGGASKPKDNSTPTPPRPDGSVVTVKLIYLPDVAHPYSVSIAGAGLGTFKGGLQLTNGWMLTNVSEESDAKVAETITAVSGLIGSVLSGGAKPKSVESKPAVVIPFLYLFEIDPSGHTLTRVDTSPLNEAMSEIAAHAVTIPPTEK
jgi:hypothetical protein